MLSKNRLWTVLFFLAAIAFAADDVETRVGPIQTVHGPVIGTLHPFEVKSFLGIPYAKPPVGELRWTYTKPPDPWTQPRECTKYSPVCPQPTVPLYGDLGPSSEDCLYLNVWTAAKVTDGKFADEKRPVLFWIHGGGFSIGAASQTWYDGSKLAYDGAVVVTINYRLGPLGFLAHPALKDAAGHSGNYGLADIEQALDWTFSNIRKFGGDPANITIWGESAGAAAVCAMMTSDLPQLYPCVRRAIVMSTNTQVAQRFADKPNGKLQSAEELGVEFQKRLGVADGPDVAKAMRAAAPADILKAARPGSPVPGISTTDNLIVDGGMLKQSVVQALINNSIAEKPRKHIPLLIGNVADEGSMFAQRAKIDTLEKYRAFLADRYGAKAENMEDLYHAPTDKEVPLALTRLFSEIFIGSTRVHAHLANEHAGEKQPNIFIYLFNHKDKPMLASGWNVYHGSELPYFFGTVDDKEKYTDEDRELSRLIRTYILNFARTGNPNSPLFPQAPEWPAYSREDEKYLILDTPITTEEKLHAKTLDALNELEKN